MPEQMPDLFQASLCSRLQRSSRTPDPPVEWSTIRKIPYPFSPGIFTNLGQYVYNFPGNLWHSRLKENGLRKGSCNGCPAQFATLALLAYLGDSNQFRFTVEDP